MTVLEAPRLETERLILKQFTLDDFPALYGLLGARLK